MRLMFRLLVGMLILTLIAIGWQFMKPEALPPAVMKKEVRKVPADVLWSGPSLGELRELHDSFENFQAPHRSSLETLVQSGESIVTEPYEGKPGEYVFTQVTPVIKTRSDGTAFVEVKVNSFGVTVSGEQHRISSDILEMGSGGGHSTWSLRTETTYKSHVSAVLEGSPPMVKLNVDGSYEKRMHSICPSEPRLGAGDVMRIIGWISALAVLLPVIAIVWQLRPTEAAASVKSDTDSNQ